MDGQTFDAYCRWSFSYCNQEERIVRILNYSMSVLEALDYVHAAGVIHRDVKPSNIMISYSGVPKLMDLGIAGMVNSELLNSKEFIGTALYAAPELVKGTDIDKRVDIYAMGVTIFEIIAGYNPFCASTQDEILSLHVSSGLPDDGSIPHELMSILKHSTERKKSKRYQSAGQFASDLKEFLFDYAPNPI